MSVMRMCVNFGDEILLRWGGGGGGNVKPEKNSIFLKKGKTVISVENQKFSRSLEPGSLYLTGYLLWIMALTCSVRNAFFSMPNPFLIVQRSFKNFA